MIDPLEGNPAVEAAFTVDAVAFRPDVKSVDA